jgi:UDP-2,4-diacetamido-2,4,6-trideoxy-beta-L-altropyranose hydrolase
LNQPILFRVEAGPKIGSGHLMRCLALAQAHADGGGSSIFVTTGEAPRLEERLGEDGFDVVHVDVAPGSPGDAARTLEIAARARPWFIVADGYSFGVGFHKRLRTGGTPVGALDDSVERRAHCADVVINQNLHASEDDYQERTAHTRLLLGAQYVLLRREFLRFSKWRRKNSPRAMRLLVTLGGSDPENVTEGIVRALAKIGSVEATVVVGGANPQREALERLALAGGSHIRVRADVRSMAGLMARSDAAISSAGSTVWELAFMGLPSVVGAATAGEERVLAGLAKYELFLGVGRFSGIPGDEVLGYAVDLLHHGDRRTAMSARARGLVDGQGAYRVLDVMRDVAASKAAGRHDVRGAVG